MANQVTQGSEVEFPEPALARGTTQPMAAAPRYSATALGYQRTYYLTRWPAVNQLLAYTDTVTKGRAGWLQRIFTYLMAGGFAAAVNLSVFQAMLLLPLGLSEQAHNLVAYLVAAEISIIANFIPNDYLTFRHLPGHARSWWQRCLRFHITTSLGTALTFVLEYTLHFVVRFGTFRIPAVVAEAIAIVIVLFFNFTMHHVFTYRHDPKASA
jgi:putative flippase GtrA